MMLVPAELHRAVAHTGGAAKCADRTGIVEYDQIEARWPWLDRQIEALGIAPHGRAARAAVPRTDRPDRAVSSR
jgi:hypothetical protein